MEGEQSPDNIDIYGTLYDMNVNLCDRFPALSPFSVRRERFHDVILIFARQISKNKRSGTRNEEREFTTKSGEKVIRRKATKDDWY